MGGLSHWRQIIPASGYASTGTGTRPGCTARAVDETWDAGPASEMRPAALHQCEATSEPEALPAAGRQESNRLSGPAPQSIIP
jgi:hypothetical protein